MPRRAERVALGLKAHIGWTAVVAVTPSLEVVAKRRLDLATTFEEGAVYHMAEPMPLAAAAAHVARARKRFERDASRAVSAMADELAAAGHQPVVAAILTGAEKALPPVATILKSHALVHAAEGELYRRAFESGLEKRGIRVVRVPGKELEARACAALGVSEAALATRLAAIGKLSGRPWAADQKQATLAAIVALHVD